MSDTPHVWITATSEQATSLLEALAGTEPEGFADRFGGSSFADVYTRRTREVLEFFGIYVSDASIPPVVELPDPDEARAVIDKLREEKQSAGGVEPHTGFRPPRCGTPPPHSATFGFVFGVIAERAS